MKHFDDLTKIDCPLGELDADQWAGWAEAQEAAR